MEGSVWQKEVQGQHFAIWPGQSPQFVSTGLSQSQCHTLQANFSSRSQGHSGDKVSVSDRGGTIEALPSSVGQRPEVGLMAPGWIGDSHM